MEQLRHSLVYDGLNREYLIYIPNNYNQSEELPLLFNFHGFGGSVSYYMSYVDMRPLAESNNFILVYPQEVSLEVILIGMQV